MKVARAAKSDGTLSFQKPEKSSLKKNSDPQTSKPSSNVRPLGNHTDSQLMNCPPMLPQQNQPRFAHPKQNQFLLPNQHRFVHPNQHRFVHPNQHRFVHPNQAGTGFGRPRFSHPQQYSSQRGAFYNPLFQQHSIPRAPRSGQYQPFRHYGNQGFIPQQTQAITNFKNKSGGGKKSAGYKAKRDDKQ